MSNEFKKCVVCPNGPYCVIQGLILHRNQNLKPMNEFYNKYQVLACFMRTKESTDQKAFSTKFNMYCFLNLPLIIL